MNQNNEKSKPKSGNKKKEILVFVIIIIVIVIVALFFYGPERNRGSEVVITIDGEEYGRYPLHNNVEIPIKVDGETTNYLIIQDGMADMIRAECPDQTCVNMKAISLDGETIVCLPNKVVVEVESDTNTSKLDAMAQ